MNWSSNAIRAISNVSKSNSNAVIHIIESKAKDDDIVAISKQYNIILLRSSEKMECDDVWKLFIKSYRAS